MIVLLDVGNSRIKLGWQHPSMGREPTVHAIALRPLEALPALLRKWLSALPMPVTSAWGVNVAGSVVAERVEHVLLESGAPIQWMLPTAHQFEVRNAYDNPQQLGADRWSALLGMAEHLEDPVRRSAEHTSQKSASGHLAAKVPRAAILATFGTATTIDTLSPELVFEGGLILPGPALMRQSLAQGTANLPLANGVGNNFPKTTLQAISTGVVAAQAGAVWRQCMIAEQHFHAPPALFVSGGGWPEVEAEIRTRLSHLKITFISNPVLDGLARMTKH
jgi:type III pantothenate kinase